MNTLKTGSRIQRLGVVISAIGICCCVASVAGLLAGMSSHSWASWSWDTRVHVVAADSVFAQHAQSGICSVLGYLGFRAIVAGIVMVAIGPATIRTVSTVSRWVMRGA